jgi:uncharacterized membrane protein
VRAPERTLREGRRALVTAVTFLGLGLGGFVDGILFHQILQVHSMLSAIYPQTTLVNVEFSMIWDGVFHAFTWASTVVGVVLTWRAAAHTVHLPWATRTLFGASVLGWGIFNVVEGTIDHFVLQIHHVVERAGLSVWDGAFLASGLLLAVAGVLLMRGTARVRAREGGAPPLARMR